MWVAVMGILTFGSDWAGGQAIRSPMRRFPPHLQSTPRVSSFQANKTMSRKKIAVIGALTVTIIVAIVVVLIVALRDLALAREMPAMRTLSPVVFRKIFLNLIANHKHL